MPACAGVPVFHPTSVRPRGELSFAWLAVVFQVAWVWMSTGSNESISSTVQLVFRAAVAARTRATSAGVMNDAVLPKLLRTYDPTDAIQSSFCVPIGIITSA